MSIFNAQKVKNDSCPCRNLTKPGFTIIEVMLFLAISALMFVALVSSTTGNISRRRYDDTVSDFAEFLRRIYSEVENTQNGRSGDGNERFGCTISSLDGTSISQAANADATAGRTNCGIYGKIIIFGENGDERAIHVYDVIGDIIDNTHKLSSSDLTLTEALKEVHAEFLTYEKTSVDTCQIGFAGGAGIYTPQWDSQIENTNSTHELFSGAVLIVRSPVNGTIHTLVADFNGTSRSIKTENVLDKTFGCADSAVSAATAVARSMDTNALLAQLIDTGELRNNVTDFCVYSEDVYGAGRRNIRLHANQADGTNASAVEVVEADIGDNACI